MKKYYHVITERSDEYISTVAIAENIETIKAHFTGQNVREIIELNAAQVNTISAAAATTIIDLTAEQPQTVTHDYTTLTDTIRAELKRKHGGTYEPNSRETWLDVQARALHQACNRIRTICRTNGLYCKGVR